MGSLYMCSTEHPVVSCCRVAAKEVGSGKHHGHHFMVETKVREMVTPQTLNKMFELDFTEQMDDKEQEYSPKDKRFLKIVCQGTQHLEDLLYEIPLHSTVMIHGLLTTGSKSSKEHTGQGRVLSRVRSFTQTMVLLRRYCHILCMQRQVKFGTYPTMVFTMPRNLTRSGGIRLQHQL